MHPQDRWSQGGAGTASASSQYAAHASAPPAQAQATPTMASWAQPPAFPWQQYQQPTQFAAPPGGAPFAYSMTQQNRLCTSLWDDTLQKCAYELTTGRICKFFHPHRRVSMAPNAMGQSSASMTAIQAPSPAPGSPSSAFIASSSEQDTQGTPSPSRPAKKVRIATPGHG
jgi:hypothetical protein